MLNIPRNLLCILLWHQSQRQKIVSQVIARQGPPAPAFVTCLTVLFLWVIFDDTFLYWYILNRFYSSLTCLFVFRGASELTEVKFPCTPICQSSLQHSMWSSVHVGGVKGESSQGEVQCKAHFTFRTASPPRTGLRLSICFGWAASFSVSPVFLFFSPIWLLKC